MTNGSDLPAQAASKLRILLADDNADSLNSLGMLLELLGHEVELCKDGTEAIRAGASFEGDVAILDIGMPGANGYEVARNLRAGAWGRNLTLIALSGWGQTQDQQQAQDAGFDHHLTKPVELDSLQRLLASIKSARAL